MTPRPLPSPEVPRTALIIFVGETEIPWLRFLKPGFRHCFAVIHDTENWIIYDPLAHQTVISAFPDAPAGDLIDWYCRLGHVVVATEIQHAPVRRRRTNCSTGPRRTRSINWPPAFFPN